MQERVVQMEARIEQLEAAVYRPSDRDHEIVRLILSGRDTEARALSRRTSKPKKKT